MKHIILDWAGNVCFNAVEFDTFDDAEAWLSEKLGDSYETDREEYYIEAKKTRDSRYLDPNDIRARKKVS
jgi:hypothetical protein